MNKPHYKHVPCYPRSARPNYKHYRPINPERAVLFACAFAFGVVVALFFSGGLE